MKRFFLVVTTIECRDFFVARVMRRHKLSWGTAKMADQEMSIEERIVKNATEGFKSAEQDDGRGESFSVEEQIKAAKFAASVKASQSSKLGIRITKMVAGGSL